MDPQNKLRGLLSKINSQLAKYARKTGYTVTDIVVNSSPKHGINVLALEAQNGNEQIHVNGSVHTTPAVKQKKKKQDPEPTVLRVEDEL